MIEARTGADLGDVAVHRGPAVAEAARDLQARAFTVDGAVHLPDEHGPLSAGAGRSLLAHELTHVAQQRVLGAGLPPESSPLGQRLEAEAVAAERSAATGTTVRLPSAATQSAPLPLAQRAPEPLTPTADPAVAAVRAGVARPAGGGSIHFVEPGGTASSGITAGSPSGSVQRAAAAEAPAAAAAPGGSPAAEAGDPADADEGQELDELARRLWPRLSERLRGDLLTQREHGGALVERF